MRFRDIDKNWDSDGYSYKDFGPKVIVQKPSPLKDPMSEKPCKKRHKKDK
jgi:hypothetical protein